MSFRNCKNPKAISTVIAAILTNIVRFDLKYI